MGTISYEEANLVSHHQGTLPVILTCPHGGDKQPPGVPKRTGAGVPPDCRFETNTDRFTRTITKGAAQLLFDVFGEARNQSRLRLRHEVLGAHLHGRERVLERAACLGQTRGLLHTAERHLDGPLARQICDSDRREPHDGDQRQHDQARAHRQIGAKA